MTDLQMSEPNKYNILFVAGWSNISWSTQSCYPCKQQKKHLSARSNCSQCLSITLHHFVTADTSEDPKLSYKQPRFLLCSLHFSFWTR